MKKPKHKAEKQNPALQPFSVLVGEWKTTGMHPYFPGIIFHGHTSYKWIEGGAFLIMKSEIEEEKIPNCTAIFGSDNASGEFFMLYFDEREVSRKYEVSFQGNILKWWRNDPAFSQRFTCEFSDQNNTIISKGEMCKDGTTWEKDLELKFSRIS
jgi:hypothetical protein